jgi:hypothetical protein
VAFSAHTVAVQRLARLPGGDAAQRVAWWMGAWFTLNGIVAFVYDPRFTDGTGSGDAHGWSPLTVRVNGWHALFHLVPGIVGLAAASRPPAAHRWAWTVAGLYLFTGVWGLIGGRAALAVVSTERFGSFVHLVEAVVAGWAAMHVSARLSPPGRRILDGFAGSALVALIIATVAAGASNYVLAMCCCAGCH